MIRSPLVAASSIWLSRLLATSAAQVAVQIVAFISGIIVIRALEPDQYAFYTLAFATLGILTVLSDGGVTTAFMAQGGKVWRDPRRLGLVFREAERLRWFLAVGAALIALPILFFLLISHSMRIGGALLVCLLIIPLFYLTVRAQLSEAVLKLHQNIWLIQTTQVAGGVGRSIVSLVMLSTVPTAWLAILVAGAVQLAINIPLTERASKLFRASSTSEPEVRARYKSHLQRSMPAAIYYAFAGQISVIIISILGDTEAVAQVGVAGRIGAACGFIGAVVGLIAVPRFARAIISSTTQLLLIYGLSLLIVLLGLIIAGVIFTWPALVDVLVGPTYEGMVHVVFWSVGASILGIASGAAYQLAAVRGYMVQAYISISVAIAAFAVSYYSIGAATPLQVFQMNSMYSSIILLTNLFCSTLMILKGRQR